MTTPYARRLPREEGGDIMQEFPSPFKAFARYSANNAVASSVITLTDDTTIVEVSAVGTSAALRWIPSTETAAVSPFASVITTAGATANFDHIISANTTRRFVVPVETIGTASVVGKGVQAGTYRRVAVMSSAAVSSVMTSEF